MSLRYARASAVDEKMLRELLHLPMDGWIRMALTREPSFFAGTEWGEAWAVLAKDGETPAGMYTAEIWSAHVNGHPMRAGYLGGLRTAVAYRNRIKVIRDGYASVVPLCPVPLPIIWYTVIMTDNRRGRRLLEANLQGMPQYTQQNEFVTLAIPTSRARRHGLWQAVETQAQRVAFCNFYNHAASAYQFSPVLTEDRLGRLPARCFIHTLNGQIRATMAIWNRQAERQALVMGYAAPLNHLCPLYNVWARLTRRICLPAPGATVKQEFLAFLAAPEAAPDVATALVADALSLTTAPVLVFGLHAGHPWLPELSRIFRPALYRAGIYTVRLAQEDEAPVLDARPAQLETSLL